MNSMELLIWQVMKGADMNAETLMRTVVSDADTERINDVLMHIEAAFRVRVREILYQAGNRYVGSSQMEQFFDGLQKVFEDASETFPGFADVALEELRLLRAWTLETERRVEEIMDGFSEADCGRLAGIARRGQPSEAIALLNQVTPLDDLLPTYSDTGEVPRIGLSEIGTLLLNLLEEKDDAE